VNEKKARWIRLQEIAKIASEMLTDKIVDKNKVNLLNNEVTAMLKHISSYRKFFKRIL